jgi:hypothetical protein
MRPVGGVTGELVHDVAVDTGGGVWATTDHYVVYQARGAAPRRLDAHDGLATGDPLVPFLGIGAGNPGQAFVGTRGKYLDVVDVAASGAVSVHHVAITNPEHVGVVTMVVRVAVDLGSAYGGTAFIGAEHGHAALHGIAAGYCFGQDGCFEEHRHSDPGGGPSGNVAGLAVCPNHDLWTGDAWWLARMPWGAMGQVPDFWAVPPAANGYPNPLIDAFPAQREDDITAIACDDQGGLWVTSFVEGLAHVDPITHAVHGFLAPAYLPQNQLTAVLVDNDGSVWVGTSWLGLARYEPSTNRWTYYNSLAGLPNDAITALAADFTATPRVIYVAHGGGLSAYEGP